MTAHNIFVGADSGILYTLGPDAILLNSKGSCKRKATGIQDGGTLKYTRLCGVECNELEGCDISRGEECENQLNTIGV